MQNGDQTTYLNSLCYTYLAPVALAQSGYVHSNRHELFSNARVIENSYIDIQSLKYFKLFEPQKLPPVNPLTEPGSLQNQDSRARARYITS
jgi:hypothetical protein